MPAGDFQITLRELLRYGYGGVLAALVCWLIWPSETPGVIKALNTGLTALGVFTVGIGVYAFHRALVNPFFEWLHRRLHSRGKTGSTCVRHHLEQKIPDLQCNSLNAFRVVRDSLLFPDRVRDQFHVQNSEVAVLNLTLTVLAVGALSLCVQQWWRSCWDRAPLLVGLNFAGLVSGAAGVFAEISICRQECAYLAALDIEKIRGVLGLRDHPQEEAGPSGV